jgi:DNA-binding response OmpR family regulator
MTLADQNISRYAPRRRTSATSRQRAMKVGDCPCCGQRYSFEKIVVSLDFNSVSFRGQTIFLPCTMTEITFVFAENMPRVVRREYLAERIWGGLSDVDRHCIDVTLVRLRRQLASLGLVLETVPGVGWRLAVVGQGSST